MTRLYVPCRLAPPSPVLTMGDDDGSSPWGFGFLVGWLIVSATVGVVLGCAMVAGWCS